MRKEIDIRGVGNGPVIRKRRHLNGTAPSFRCGLCPLAKRSVNISAPMVAYLTAAESRRLPGYGRSSNRTVKVQSMRRTKENLLLDNDYVKRLQKRRREGKGRGGKEEGECYPAPPALSAPPPALRSPAPLSST